MSDAAARQEPPVRPARSLHDSFALLAECLLVGVYVLIGSLPVITLPAALAAGCAHIGRHLAGERTDLARFARDWWSAVKDLWLLGVAALVLAVLLTVNVQVAASGALPGGDVVRWVSLAVGAVGAVVVLRVAGRWSRVNGKSDDDGARARDLVPLAARVAREDPTGSLLLLLALGLCGVLIWMLAPLVIVVGGLLSLAVVAVEHRHERRDEQA
ncbi:hypothetical protein [Myceligenerans crystallogenes]|uniref:Integral membrane protein n=1 Tax=Myceligenerans crystallogenes TaxID=316335 RepID=A0ABN2N1S4_9MICO